MPKASKHGPLRCGHTGSDGRVFWGYTKCRGIVFEQWYSPDAFERKYAKNRARKGAWAKDPKNKPLIREFHLRREFGISLATYDFLLELQQGVCAICKKPETNRLFKRLAVDHCHATGKIRGLLCNRCNKSIGLFEDCPKRLAAASRYIKRKH